jgi:CDP-glucose 4,6-dehydratase
MFCDFFVGKRVLVTGIAGVKGTWMALELLEAGSAVVGVDISQRGETPVFDAAGLRGRVECIQGDITHFETMRDLIATVDCVFHLAAIALVGDANRRPLDTYRVNTLGTATVLEAVRQSTTAKYVVIATTDKVYRPSAGHASVETDALCASSPYPISKACAEYIIADYHRMYLKGDGKHSGIGRSGNVIVGGDLHSSTRTGGAGRLFVDCFESLSFGRPPEVFCPQLSRSYVYGLDVVIGYMALMSRLDRPEVDGQPFNFGPREDEAVRSDALATQICEIWGRGATWRLGPPRPEPFESEMMSSAKSRRLLGWEPAYSLTETLTDTARWYDEWAKIASSSRASRIADVSAELIHKHRLAAEMRGHWWTQ